MVAHAEITNSLSNVDTFCLVDTDWDKAVGDLSGALGASGSVVAFTSGAAQKTLSEFWEKTHQRYGYRDPKSAGFCQSLIIRVPVELRLRLSLP